MYYLDRQQNEKFHNWARRVHKRFIEIRNENIYYSDLFLSDTDITFRLLFPNIYYFFNYGEYPNSFIKVQQYIKNIKNYEELYAIYPTFYLCPFCNLHTCENFFSDYCKMCDTPNKQCKKCDKVIYLFHNDISDNWKISLAFPSLHSHLFMKIKYNVTYKDWCIDCFHLDFSARLFQYVWRQYKNRQHEWKDEIIYRFINNFINNNINKNALFQVFSSSKDFDCTTTSKMQNVLKVYNM